MSSTTSDESNENEQSEKQQRFPAILIIGEVGVGKSTVANMIAGKYRDGGPFTKSDEVQPYPVTINGINYILIDTPGLILSEDQDQSSIDIISQIDELIQSIDQYLEIVSIILVLDSNRMSKTQKQNFRQIVTAYLNIIIIVFTKGTYNQTTSRQYMETTFNTELRGTVGKRGIISGRWVIIPNPDDTIFPMTSNGKENEHILKNLSLLNKLIISLTPPKYQLTTGEPEIIGLNKLDLERGYICGMHKRSFTEVIIGFFLFLTASTLGLAYILYYDVIDDSPYRWVYGGFGIASTILFFLFVLCVYCIRINQVHGI
ncbi:4035_t:CDS:2 [Dentiscutata heterogama]|uniref:4035_t:CDS:1 n=1 Tax=Dentiscutata heterogama TaxID=1316150 RepID=A0ACA9KRE1_9GLOM|nr:4035_t:CDS:2 [Dentiscutata heterogama]